MLLAKAVIPFAYYDKATNQSILHYLPECDLVFPIDEVIRRIPAPKEDISYTKDASLRTITIAGRNITMDSLSSEPYYYLSIRGKQTFESIRKLVEGVDGSPFREDYMFSNDPLEMTEYLGVLSAQAIHEYSYWRSLGANNFVLSYEHINVLCAKMFGYNLCPISPQGFRADGWHGSVWALCICEPSRPRDNGAREGNKTLSTAKRGDFHDFRPAIPVRDGVCAV